MDEPGPGPEAPVLGARDRAGSRSLTQERRLSHRFQAGADTEIDNHHRPPRKRRHLGAPIRRIAQQAPQQDQGRITTRFAVLQAFGLIAPVRSYIRMFYIWKRIATLMGRQAIAMSA